MFSSFDVVRVTKFKSPTGEKEEKIIANTSIEGVDGFVPLFLTPVVTKSGSSRYSNSKAYDLLVTSGLIGDFGEFVKSKTGVIKSSDLSGYLEARLAGRSVRVLVENVKDSKGADSYSVVKKVFEVTPQGPQVYGGLE